MHNHLRWHMCSIVFQLSIWKLYDEPSMYLERGDSVALVSSDFCYTSSVGKDIPGHRAMLLWRPGP